MSQNEATATRLFLSYARGDDEAFVRRLYTELTAVGFTVWFDRVSMPSRQLSFFQEIRDEIALCDRVVFVVGPQAVTSDYVTQEWRFGLEVGKGINPIIRLDGEFADGYELIPEELKTLHAEDFRDDASFRQHFENLVRQLSQPVARPGSLIGVPALPNHYRAQPQRLQALKNELLADLRRAVVVTGAAARVGVQGMGGIGKSVLAASLARDLETRRAFPDGVMWIGIGQQPNILELQRNAVRALKGEAIFDNVDAGSEVLRNLLENRAILIALDDVWEMGHVKAFDVIGPRCRLLLTTRDSALVDAVAGSGFQVELPSQNEALAILASSASMFVTSLPPAASQIVDECGRLPLALALCGGMAHAGTPWTDILAALRDQDLKFIATLHASEPQHLNVWRAMEVSVAALPELEQARFAELSIFGHDTAIPEATVVTLWSHTAGLDERDCRQLLISLKNRALVQLDIAVGAATDVTSAHVSMHDLLYDMAALRARPLYPSAKALHGEVLAAYAKRSPDGWSSGPPDGYFFQHLRTHLVQAGEVEQLLRLVVRPEWIELKSNLPTASNALRVSQIGDIYDLLEDFSSGLRYGSPSGELEFAKYLSRIVRAQFPTWIDAPNRLYPQLYPFLKSAPSAIADAAQTWLDLHFSRCCQSGPWFKQLTPVAHDAPDDYATIQIEGESPETLAFSSDSQLLIGASYRQLRGWSPITCRELFSHVIEPSAAVLIKELDEKNSFLIVLRSGTVLYLNAQGRIEERAGPKIGIACADVASGGRRLAIGDQFGQLGIWNLDKGNWIAQRKGSRTPIRVVCFDRDGNRLLVARETGLYSCFDADGLQPVLERPLSGHILHCLPSPSGNGWYLGGLDGSVKLWEFATQSAMPLPETAHSPIDFLSRCGDVLLASDLAGDIRVWNLATEEFKGESSLNDGSIQAIALSGDRLAMSSGSTVRVLSLASVIHSGQGSKLSISTNPGWLGDCTHAISGTEGGDVAAVSGELQPFIKMTRVAPFTGPAAALPLADLWIAGSGRSVVVLKPMKGRLLGHGVASGRISSVSVDGSGSVLAGGFRTGLGVIWDSRSVGELGRFQMHTGSVASLVFGNDASQLVSAGEDGSVVLWQLNLRPSKKRETIVVAQGRALPRLDSSKVKSAFVDNRDRWTQRPISALALSQDNRMLVIAVENQLLIWSFPSFKPIVEKAHVYGRLSQIAVSPDGTLLGGLSDEGRCVVWRIEDWSIVCEYQTFTPGLGCAWSPDGRTIVIAAAERLMIFAFEGLTIGDPIVMPSPAKRGKLLRLNCPHQRLRKPWSVSLSKLGKTVICPECGGRLKIASTMLQPLEVQRDGQRILYRAE